MIYSQTGSYAGYGFAIPTAIMNKVVDDLKQYGTVRRAYLGIRGGDLLDYVNSLKEQNKDVPDFGTNTGIYVDTVEDNSAASAAGLKKGDVIIGIDDQKVTKMAELQEQVNNKRPGDKATIVWMRDKKKMSKTVTLKNQQGNTRVVKTADLNVLGAKVFPGERGFEEATQYQLWPASERRQERCLQGWWHQRRLHHLDSQ